jgi:hypothetical protein
MRERLVRESYSQPRRLSIPPPLAWAGVVVIVAVAAAGWLWAHYGATVFFESIRAGFAACFG